MIFCFIMSVCVCVCIMIHHSPLVLVSVFDSYLRSFRSVDTGTVIHRHVPDFCTVFIISKGKIFYMRKAIRPAPRHADPLPDLEDHRHAAALRQTWNLSAEQESNRGMRHQIVLYNPNSNNSSSRGSGRPSIEPLFTPQMTDLDAKFLDSDSSGRKEISSRILVRVLSLSISVRANQTVQAKSMKSRHILEFCRKKGMQRCRGSDYN